MIKITNIKHGWLTLTISDGKNRKSFDVSYLDDFKLLMDILLSLDNRDFQGNNSIKRIYFDGEGHDLYLTGIREYYGDNFYLVWEQYEERPTSCLFKFNFDEFKMAFENEFARVQNRYYQHFDWNAICAREEEMMDKNHDDFKSQ